MTDNEPWAKKSGIWQKNCPLPKGDIFINDIKKIESYTRTGSKISRSTSVVQILKSTNPKEARLIVKKQFKTHCTSRRPVDPNEMYANELHALKLLHGCNGFPQLLYYDNSQMTIYMSYCGTKLTRSNVPADWRGQLLEIHKTMRTKGLYSNDVYIGNFCVLDNKLYFIDFGYAKHHLDYCFRNMSKDDIKAAVSIFDMLEGVSARAKACYSMLHDPNQN